ncbi:dihydroorotate dehydrogenase B (NAD(+)), electron transfer subunit [Clostridia bacterium]|nr:dihydroorotate dehydrogenase B (NAD(+)), electron transfer subunit [Clostridia bacterium]
MELETVKILKNHKIAEDIYELLLYAPNIWHRVLPGQFAEIYLENGINILPRPLSICHAALGNLRIIYKTVGDGTRRLSEFREGDGIRILAPLGNGFPVDFDASYEHIVIGGGIGVVPLLRLAQTRRGDVRVFLGFRAKEQIILREDFAAATEHLRIATDDGSYGYHGNIISLVKEELAESDKPRVIYACGPKPLLRAVQSFAAKNNTLAYLSLEERMGCGFGACIGCVVKTVHGYKKVCKDGTVFLADEVIFDE